LFDFFFWPGDLLPIENDEQGLVYFCIAASIMLLCLLATFLLEQSSFYQYYQKNAGKAAGENLTTIQDVRSVGDSSTEETEGFMTGQEPPITRMSVLRKLWPDALNVFLVFFISLSLFPGFTVMMPSYSTNPKFSAAFVTILISLFQLGDFVGRMAPTFIAPLFLRNYLWILVWSRFAFFPLFILSICQVHVFKQDWIPIVVMTFFSISNGYLGSLGMMWAPKRVTDPREQGIAGTMMSFFLQFGIFTAVHFAFLLKYFVTGSVLDDSVCNITDI